MSRDITGYLNTNSSINPQIGDYFYILHNGSNWYYCDQNGGIASSNYMFASGEANSSDFYINLISYNNSNATTSVTYLHPDGSNFTGSTILKQKNTTFYNAIISYYDPVNYTLDYVTSNLYYKITLQSVTSQETNLAVFFNVESGFIGGGNSGGGNNSGVTTNNSKACFSQQTLLKLLQVLPKDRFYLMTKLKRENKKMYSLNYNPFGNMDFTFDHQFVYKNKVYTFENLTKIHPLFKRAIEKSSDPEEYIYNIYGSYDKKYFNNMIELGPNVLLMGGKLFNKTTEYFEEIENKINSIKKEDLINFTVDKFINSGIDSDMVHLVFVSQH